MFDTIYSTNSFFINFWFVSNVQTDYLLASFVLSSIQSIIWTICCKEHFRSNQLNFTLKITLENKFLKNLSFVRCTIYVVSLQISFLLARIDAFKWMLMAIISIFSSKYICEHKQYWIEEKESLNLTETEEWNVKKKNKRELYSHRIESYWDVDVYSTILEFQML